MVFDVRRPILMKGWLLLALLGLASMPARAAINIFACEPEWAALASTLVPDASITSATTAFQDPHYIEARPGLIAAVRNADLVLCTGAGLEAGWLPVLLQKSANAAVQSGASGLFFAAEQVKLHQSHSHVDRSLGDVHAEGDPHIQLDPDRVAIVMAALAQRLCELRPNQSAAIRTRHLRWRVQWNIARAHWREQAQQLAGMQVVIQHSSFSYLLRWLGVATKLDLEPKPGLPPSAAHLNRILNSPQLGSARVILITSYQNARPAKWLAQRTGLELAVMPATVNAEYPELKVLIQSIVDRLLAHRQEPQTKVQSHE
jgi:zinc/manganese transport system substrate-binding protein